MSFANPYIFFILIVPFIAFAFLVLTNKEGAERVFSKQVLERIKVEGSGLSNRIRNSILFLAIFFMIVAMSEPYIDKGEQKIKLSGLEAVVALDISGSMRVKDRYPNRLQFAKKKIKSLLKELPKDEIMLLTFADGVFLVSPFTSDKETLESVLDGISNNYILNYTNYKGLAYALKHILKNRKQKIAIIVSDGGSKDELTELERVVKQSGIKLYAILVGTEEGATLLDKQGKAILKDGEVVISKVNRYLGDIAKRSGGDYIVADYSDDIPKLVKKIKEDNSGVRSGESIKIAQKVELFYYPLTLATILLLLSFISTPKPEDMKINFKGFKNAK